MKRVAEVSHPSSLHPFELPSPEPPAPLAVDDEGGRRACGRAGEELTEKWNEPISTSRHRIRHCQQLEGGCRASSTADTQVEVSRGC
ncbi:unnamed protein product [Didymodactylos carnosus]|uniref:Uncharacterized protein n=1 Tax=Didymodactylos carnosus TaxID=1234261 RepID=A0A814XNR2_9BILA|nr:unnamed protein product [Didymodactylos carnosus]CAF1383070.1 unnamed protein product [Didymodactylos carnosus]CAF3978304.1 unnamed protein product [Didymodactylos carnosus]CAF4191387.1 unnamed protein product [Didymodactylos carnosus]